MKCFCRNFCFKCKQCKEAEKEIMEEERIMKEVDGPYIIRTEEEKAALDCKGRP